MSRRKNPLYNILTFVVHYRDVYIGDFTIRTEIHLATKHTKKGFTLAEVLIAVALIIVLIGIAVPAIGKTYQDMELTKLDSQARIIYAAAQNRFMSYQTAGTIKDVVPADTYDYKMGEVKDTTKLANVPVDVGDESNHYSTKDQIIYISSNDIEGKVIINKLFSKGVLDSNIMDSINNDHAQVVIEYDPSNGSVYGVFYSETPFTYNADYKVEENRTRDSRKAMAFSGEGERAGERVGFYGGDATHVDPPIYQPNIRVSLEEMTGTGAHPSGLYVKLDISDAYITNKHLPGIDISKWTYNIKMAQLDDEGEIVKDESGNEKIALEDSFGYSESGNKDSKYFYSYSDGQGIYYVLIDSLESGYHFADKFSDGSIVQTDAGVSFDVGANVKFSISIAQNAEEGSAVGEDQLTGVSDSINKIFNPLYASSKRKFIEDGEDSGKFKLDSVIAQVASPRQLENLNMDISGISEEYAPTYVTQKSDIDLSELEDIQVSHVATASTKPIYEKGKFVPIFNSELSNYNGQNHKISNMDATTYHSTLMGRLVDDSYIDGNQEAFSTSGGLFALVYNKNDVDTAVLSNINLVNPIVSTPTSLSSPIKLGTIAGTMIKTNVNNCKVYCEDTGEADYDYDKYGIFDIQSNSQYAHMGGFVCDVYDCNIVNSFVSIPNIIGRVKDAGTDFTEVAFSSARAGGFAHNLATRSSCNVERCYANIGTVDGFTYSAGFVAVADGYSSGGDAGDATSMQINSCYAVGNHISPNAVGFVGFIDRTYLNNCYSACTYGDDADEKKGWINGFTYGSFLRLWEGAEADSSVYDNCSYLAWGRGIPSIWNTYNYDEADEEGNNHVYGGLLLYDFNLSDLRYDTIPGINYILYRDFADENYNADGAIEDFTRSGVADTKSYKLDGTYPFPSIIGQTHYGDWSLPRDDDPPAYEPPEEPTDPDNENGLNSESNPDEATPMNEPVDYDDAQIPEGYAGDNLSNDDPEDANPDSIPEDVEPFADEDSYEMGVEVEIYEDYEDLP